MGIQFFGSRASGHAWKVRQALVLLGIDHEFVYVDLSVPRGQRPPDFEEASPFGEVPVLVEDGRIYAQSNAILLKLSRDTGRLGGGDQSLLERWLFWEANRLGFSAAHLRWEMVFAQERSPAAIDALRARTHADLDVLGRQLANRSFVLGEQLSMADLSCAAYLQYADEAGLEMENWPQVEAWLKLIADVPGIEHPYQLLARERASNPPPPPGGSDHP